MSDLPYWIIDDQIYPERELSPEEKKAQDREEYMFKHRNNKVNMKRVKDADKYEALALEMGGVVLFGSFAQSMWANQIRGEYIKKMIKKDRIIDLEKILKSNKFYGSKFWIENSHKLFEVIDKKMRMNKKAALKKAA